MDLASRISLPELDSYFGNIPIFVPGSQTGHNLKNASDCEKELREGKVQVGGAAVQEIMEKEGAEKI